MSDDKSEYERGWLDGEKSCYPEITKLHDTIAQLRAQIDTLRAESNPPSMESAPPWVAALD